MMKGENKINMEKFDCKCARVIPRNGTSSHENLKKRLRDVHEKDKRTVEENGKVLTGVSLGKTNGASVLRDITNSRFVEEEGKGKCRGYRWKNEVARERWKMLAKALLKPKKTSGRCPKAKDISVRRFSSFDLITPSKLDKLEKVEGYWLKYTAKYLNSLYLIEVHRLEPRLTPRELIGFNNTGNICIWPSEEVLAHYALSKISLFEGKEVLEVGGGMTCLAGVMLAKYGKVKRMDLTDGNLVSVENVRKIIWRNQLNTCRGVAAFQLDWMDHEKLRKKYDIVLSSDCLFFDETRADLVETIWNSLRENGVALVMAPKRGNTLDSFVKMAAQKGFYYVLQTYYDDTVWQQHLKFKDLAPEYEEDLQTDYWVSQGRKFCEFCKCSIADNKPSIQFHENGKKHKENVAKRLTEMQKKAAKDAKDAANFDKDLKRMEAAALKAYMNDVKSNADYTSQLIQQGLETLPEPEYVEPEPKPKPKSQGRKPEKKQPFVRKWMEAVSEEGQTYYWNVDTGESVWEKPTAGYLSIADQEKQKSGKPLKGPPKHKKHKRQGKFNPSKNKAKATEGKTEEKKDIKMDFGPIPYSPPFGKWKKVEPPKQEPVDLQLPKQEFVQIAVPKLKEESKGFKEKTSTVGIISSTPGEIGFKKRKIAADAKKNMRQRLNDD